MIRTFLAVLIFSIAFTCFAEDADHCLHANHSALLENQFDVTSGNDTRNYPPDMQVDFGHLKLEIDMSDPLSKSFRCNETLTFTTLDRPIKTLKLDCVNLKISKITDIKDKPLQFSQDDETITIRFDEEIAIRTDTGVKIAYECRDPKEGMSFSIPDEAYKDRPLSIYTQGETETNRHWFISHDYPNDRMTSELIVTIPAKYKALSNGALVSRKADGDKVVYHYKLNQPHVSYLVSLVVGEFEVVTETWKDKPVEY